MRKNPPGRKRVLEEEENFFSENWKIFGKDLKHIFQQLRLPEHLTKDLKASKEGSLEDGEVAQVLENLRGLLEDGHHFLLPSFFELLIFLTKTDRKFGLLFRTFGNDFGLVNQKLEQ